MTFIGELFFIAMIGILIGVLMVEGWK